MHVPEVQSAQWVIVTMEPINPGTPRAVVCAAVQNTGLAHCVDVLLSGRHGLVAVVSTRHDCVAAVERVLQELSSTQLRTQVHTTWQDRSQQEAREQSDMVLLHCVEKAGTLDLHTVAARAKDHIVAHNAAGCGVRVRFVRVQEKQSPQRNGHLGSHAQRVRTLAVVCDSPEGATRLHAQMRRTVDAYYNPCVGECYVYCVQKGTAQSKARGGAVPGQRTPGTAVPHHHHHEHQQHQHHPQQRQQYHRQHHHHQHQHQHQHQQQACPASALPAAPMPQQGGGAMRHGGWQQPGWDAHHRQQNRYRQHPRQQQQHVTAATTAGGVAGAGAAECVGPPAAVAGDAACHRSRGTAAADASVGATQVSSAGESDSDGGSCRSSLGHSPPNHRRSRSCPSTRGSAGDLGECTK